MQSELYNLVLNYPKDGINFKDISKFLESPELIEESMKYFENYYKTTKITKIVGIESRGFLIGGMLARVMKVPFVMMRKTTSLLPLKVLTTETDIEYRDKTGFQIQENSITKKDHILIVDDVLATGKSIIAANKLIMQAGAVVSGAACWLFIPECDGIDNIKKTLDINVAIFEIAYSEKLNKNVETLLNKKVETKSKNIPYNISNNPFVMNDPLILGKLLNDPLFSFDVRKKYVLVHNDMKDWINPNYHKFRYIILDKFAHFPDGYPNIEYPAEVNDSDVIYIGSMYDYNSVMDQVNFLVALSRNVESLRVYFPYYGPGTMERITEPGVVATADSMGYIISRCLVGRPKIHVFDLHVSITRFGLDPQCNQFKEDTAVYMALSEFKAAYTTFALAFPDEGSYKRFVNTINGYTKKTVPLILMAKKREGDVRTITLLDVQNIEKSLDQNIDIIIFDDIVNSGGTIFECRNALLKYGFKNVSAYCTHAVMPLKKHYMNFLTGGDYAGLKAFFIANTNPQRSELLKDKYPFIVVDVRSVVFKKSYNREITVVLCSKNKDKYDACVKYFEQFINIKIETIDPCSEVNNQPLNIIETIKGASNRIKNAKKLFRGDINNNLFISIENGIDNGGDFAVIMYNYNNKQHHILSRSVKINPTVLNLLPKDGSKTAGQIYNELYNVPASNWHKLECGFNRSYIIYKGLEVLMENVEIEDNKK